jgi:hypothetical protein
MAVVSSRLRQPLGRDKDRLGWPPERIDLPWQKVGRTFHLLVENDGKCVETACYHRFLNDRVDGHWAKFGRTGARWCWQCARDLEQAERDVRRGRGKSARSQRIAKLDFVQFDSVPGPPEAQRPTHGPPRSATERSESGVVAPPRGGTSTLRHPSASASSREHPKPVQCVPRKNACGGSHT